MQKIQAIEVNNHTARADYGFPLSFPSTLHMGAGSITYICFVPSKIIAAAIL